MREEKRIQRILKLIETYWENNSNQSFGQMLINLGICEDDIRLWNYSDDESEEHLKMAVKKYE